MLLFWKKMMNFKDTDYSQFYLLTNTYTNHDLVQSMKKYSQHGKVSTYEHCLNVAKICYWIDKHFSLGLDEKTLLTSAVLHDFYLYDWHNKSINKTHSLHGFSHPDTAAENAKKYFDITPKEENAIRSHMWPLTITKFPKSREAYVLCLADKYCAVKETFKGK